MEDIERARRFKNLGSDPVFRELVEAVKDDQVAVFVRATSTPEEREDAHAAIKALTRIVGKTVSAASAIEMAERNSEKQDGP